MSGGDTWPALERVMEEVRQGLDARGVEYVIEHGPDEPRLYAIAAYDGTYMNEGLIGCDERGTVSFWALDPERDRQAEEWDNPDEAPRYWQPDSVAVMVYHLAGDVREILADHRGNAK